MKKNKKGKNIFKNISFKAKVSDAKNRIIETLELPRELTGEYARISMIDNISLLIEGKNSIVDYYDNYIKIQTNNVYIILDGKELKIDEITDNEVIVSGQISNLSYLSR